LHDDAHGAEAQPAQRVADTFNGLSGVAIVTKGRGRHKPSSKTTATSSPFSGNAQGLSNAAWLGTHKLLMDSGDTLA
jgi:hypothetical protein